MELQHKQVTEQILGAAFEVHKVLGYGFLEKVYQRAMLVDLQARGLKAEIEAEIRVLYKGVEVGVYKADLWVNEGVLVELKVAKAYNPEDKAQHLNE
jgi:GxxExxY protein